MRGEKLLTVIKALQSRVLSDERTLLLIFLVWDGTRKSEVSFSGWSQVGKSSVLMAN